VKRVIGMAQTLELLDGSYITPMSIFDVLDTVEEYAGTDVRQYLESYFIDGDEPVERDEHLVEVLESIEDIVAELERVNTDKQSRKKDIQYNLDRLRATIRRGIGDE